MEASAESRCRGHAAPAGHLRGERERPPAARAWGAGVGLGSSLKRADPSPGCASSAFQEEDLNGGLIACSVCGV